jgi:tol-pal system-associated acyl-CoA thioesterase
MSKAITETPISQFSWPVRVYIEDTDAGNIVFYVNYLKYMERARTESLRSLGFEKAGVFDDDAMFVVHSLAIDYKAPARLDDLLTVSADIQQLKRTSLTFNQRVWRDDELLCTADVKIACVSRSAMRPVAIPDTLLNAIKQQK